MNARRNVMAALFGLCVSAAPALAAGPTPTPAPDAKPQVHKDAKSTKVHRTVKVNAMPQKGTTPAPAKDTKTAPPDSGH